MPLAGTFLYMKYLRMDDNEEIEILSHRFKLVEFYPNIFQHCNSYI